MKINVPMHKHNEFAKPKGAAIHMGCSKIIVFVAAQFFKII